MKAFKHSIKGKRNKNDFYPTHHSLVWQLIASIDIPKQYNIHDPASGENDIIKALRECGVTNNITGKDLTTGDDFLIEENSYDIIFTNPPFSLADVFLEKAFDVAKESVIFLLPLDYLHGLDRYNSFYKEQKKFYLSEVYVLVRRPMFSDCVRDDGCYPTGSVTFAWYIWNKIKGDFTDPKIKWINNNDYAIGSKSNKTDLSKQEELF